MKILAIGDIVGDTGVKFLQDNLSRIKRENNIDFIIANVENSADGMGLTKKTYDILKFLDIDVMTMGNHTWSKKDVFTLLENNNIIRPANFYKDVAGKRV